MAKSRVKLTRNVVGLGYAGDLVDNLPETTIAELLGGDACEVIEREPAKVEQAKAAPAKVESAMLPKAKARGE